MLYGKSVGVSEVALLIAAAFWTWLWGPIGLVLSTPLAVILVVLGKYVPYLEFLDVLIGDQPALEPHVVYYQRLLAQDEDEAMDLVEDYLKKHSAEKLFDAVLLPALMLARHHRERGELSTQDERFIVQTTREILENLDLSSTDPEEGPEDQAPERGEQAPPKLILACPARDEAMSWPC